MASDKRRQQPPLDDTSCKPALRPHPDAAAKDSAPKSAPKNFADKNFADKNFAPKPHHPPPEDEYGGGDIVSPEPPEPTEDDKPLS